MCVGADVDCIRLKLTIISVRVYQITKKKRAIVKLYLKYPPNMEKNDEQIDIRFKPEFFFLMRC
jgi:hypothetical protein